VAFTNTAASKGWGSEKDPYEIKPILNVEITIISDTTCGPICIYSPQQLVYNSGFSVLNLFINGIAEKSQIKPKYPKIYLATNNGVG
jgi:hypothetical protein